MCEGTENRKNGNEKRRKRDRNWYDRTFKELQRELLLKKKCRTANTFLASMDCWSHWTANKLKCVKLIFGHCVVRIVDMSIWLLNPKIYSRTHTHKHKLKRILFGVISLVRLTCFLCFPYKREIMANNENKSTKQWNVKRNSNNSYIVTFRTNDSWARIQCCCSDLH